MSSSASALLRASALSLAVLALAACKSSSTAATSTTTSGAGGSSSSSPAGGAGGTSTGATTGKVWTECPPQGAAPDGGMIGKDTYDGQPCAGTLSCQFYYGDCANLSGYGPSCECESGFFVCKDNVCSGGTTTGGGGSGGAGGAGGAAQGGAGGAGGK
jgi:hypothetical protein